MAKKASTRRIGRAELRVLDYVQAHGPVTVRQVAEHFATTEGVGRTTILNVLLRLWRKDHLSRAPGPAGGHLYAAREPRPRLLRRLVGEFARDVLGGSVSPFVAHLVDAADHLTDADRQQLVALLEQLENKQADKKRAGEKGRL